MTGTPCRRHLPTKSTRRGASLRCTSKATRSYSTTSAWRYLKGEKNTPPHDALYFSMSGFGAVRQGPWKLVLPPQGTPQLFNLANDIGELRDLAASESARVKALVEKWNVWHAQMPAPVKPAGKAKSGKSSG